MKRFQLIVVLLVLGVPNLAIACKFAARTKTSSFSNEERLSRAEWALSGVVIGSRDMTEAETAGKFPLSSRIFKLAVKKRLKGTMNNTMEVVDLGRTDCDSVIGITHLIDDHLNQTSWLLYGIRNFDRNVITHAMRQK